MKPKTRDICEKIYQIMAVETINTGEWRKARKETLIDERLLYTEK